MSRIKATLDELLADGEILLYECPAAWLSGIHLIAPYCLVAQGDGELVFWHEGCRRGIWFGKLVDVAAEEDGAGVIFPSEYVPEAHDGGISDGGFRGDGLDAETVADFDAFGAEETPVVGAGFGAGVFGERTPEGVGGVDAGGG